jgi:hypothetical protein
MGKRTKTVTHTGTISGCIDDARSAVEELKDEMESWRDNMEEKLGHTEKYERVSECADALDSMLNELEPDVPEWLQEVEVTYTEETSKRGLSRAARLGNAVSMLEAVTSYLENDEDKLKELAEKANEGKEGDDKIDPDDMQAEAEQLASDLSGPIDEAGGVEFPGMFG